MAYYSLHEEVGNASTEPRDKMCLKRVVAWTKMESDRWAKSILLRALQAY